MQSRSFIRMALFSLLVFTLAGAAFAKPKPQLVRITVSVINPDAQPVRNAGVVIRQVADAKGKKVKHPIHIELKTDQNGNASIDLFEQGRVEVQVIAPGYQTFGDLFTVMKPEEMIKVQLAQPKAQISIYKQELNRVRVGSTGRTAALRHRDFHNRVDFWTLPGSR